MSTYVEGPILEAEGALRTALGARRAVKSEPVDIYGEDVDFTVPDNTKPENSIIHQTPATADFYHTNIDSKVTPIHDKDITNQAQIKQEHNDLTGDTKSCYECPICYKVFKRDLKRHLVIHRQEEIDCVIGIVKAKERRGKFECHYCGIRTKRRRGLINHLKKYAQLDPFQQQLHAKMPNWKIIKNVFECDACGRRLSRKEGLLRHLDGHANDDIVICSNCNEPFKYGWELLDHLKLGVCKTSIKVTPKLSNKDVKLFKPCFVKIERLIDTKTEVKLERLNESEVSENEVSEDENEHLGTEEAYYCGVCEVQFETLHLLDTHFCKRPKKPVTCKICLKKLKFQSDLIIHNRLHTGETPYTCDVCKKQFRLKNSMKQHIRSMHLGEKLYACKMCQEKFSSQFSLNKHIRWHTGEKEKKPYACKVCKKRFKRERDCSEHFRVHTLEKPFKCEVCHKAFRLEVYLRHHRRIHSGEKPYKCEVCDKSFRIWVALDHHKRVHTNERPYQCDICKKRYKRLDTLWMHKRIHTGQKPFVCEFCSKRFTQRTHLTSHMRIHTGEKEFACTVCGKLFGEACKLRAHNRVHTGEKPYSCVVCEKSFRFSGALREHKRLHTGEKPFACEVCKKAFARKYHMKDHMRCHSKEYPFFCEGCSRRFQKRDYLRLHKKVCKIKMCESCGVKYANKEVGGHSCRGKGL